MTTDLKMTRRQLLATTAAGTVFGLTAAGLTSPAFAADTTVGFIYVGPKDDYGYNQAHAEGAAVLKAMPGVKVVEEENVPETVHDQPRRCFPGLSNVVWLLRPSHAGHV
jgi:basic membrane protein A and related proteins